MVTIFALGLILKVSSLAGAEMSANAEEARVEVADEVVQKDVRVAENVEDPRLSFHQASPQPVNYDQPAQQGPVLPSTHESSSNYDSTSRAALIPMLGGSRFAGRWGDHISNRYNLGLILEIPVVPALAFEVEGGFGRYNIAYSYYGHDFNQYQLGANIKIYIIRSFIQPYIGGGVAALYFENMTRGPRGLSPYHEWVGNGQLFAGADVNLSERLAIGVRGSWLTPLIHRPITADNGFNSYPYFEEAAAMNTNQFRFMGSLRVSL